jgi:hypothetical protein
VLNTVTGVCGLAAMLWLYGVAWHQPMAQSIAWARTTVAEALPSVTSLLPGGLAGGTAPGNRAARSAAPPPSAATSGGPISMPSLTSKGGSPRTASGPVDPVMDAQFAERRAKIAAVKDEGPRMLRAGNWRRAAELCRAWADLDLGNADAWRCLGQALQAQGQHQDAITAFRKAKQYDPADTTLDAAIDRSQKGIVADFQGRYRR